MSLSALSSPADRAPAAQTAPEGRIVPFPSAHRDHAQRILVVEFRSPDGRGWRAIGGGDTLADAIAFAHDSCPAGAFWHPVGWNDLYGD